MKKLILAFSLLGLTSVFGQSFTEIIKAVASDRGEDDNYGYAVAIDGDYAVIGAYSDDFGTLNPNMGSVYVYQQIGMNNWVEIQKLQASDQDDYDRFGWSVDISGDYLIVGAYGEDEDENDANTLSKAGSAYIFEKDGGGTWVEVQKIVASDRDADDEFGWSVAIWGTTAVVGAHIEDHDENGNNYIYHTGSVYVFDRDGGGVWNESQKIVAADRAADMNYPGGYSGEDLADQFGGSVDIWGDWMIVGAHHHDYGPGGPPTGALWSSGAAYIFERSSGTWAQVQKIQNFDRESWDRFGYAVAIDTNFIAVGAYSEDEIEDGVSDPLTNPGSVYIFERDPGGTWNAYQKIVPNDRNSGDHFGYSIEIRDTLMVIGTHSDDHDENGANLLDDAGSAYIFENNSGVWAQFQKIDASDRVTGDELGIDVAMSGNTILAGAYLQDYNDIGADSLTDAGAAYFYSNVTCSPSSTNQTVNICSGSTYSIGTSTYSTTGTYVDVLLSTSGCDSTVTTDLVVDPAIQNNIYVNICSGDTYYIGGFPYSSTGNYSEPFTAANGCDSIVITHLTVDPPITSEQWVSVCYGESYTIGASTYTTTGTYTDIVTATNFCDSIITTHLQIELPVNISISQSQSTLSANANGAIYQWFSCDSGNPISGATNQIYNATTIGSYGVIVTENGCTDTSACVYVSEIVQATDQLKLDNDLRILPNPNNGEFVIYYTGDASSSLNISILNSLGQVIYQDIMTGNQYPVSIQGNGVYIVRIEKDNSSIYRKIVIRSF